MYKYLLAKTGLQYRVKPAKEKLVRDSKGDITLRELADKPKSFIKALHATFL
jgi:hypothetical protein